MVTNTFRGPWETTAFFAGIVTGNMRLLSVLTGAGTWMLFVVARMGGSSSYDSRSPGYLHGARRVKNEKKMYGEERLA